MSSQSAGGAVSAMGELGDRSRAVRRGRAALKREVQAAGAAQDGRDTLAAIVEDSSPALRTLMVWEALGWLHMRLDHRHGLMRHIGASDYRQFGELTERQRRVLCHALRSPVMVRRAA